MEKKLQMKGAIPFREMLLQDTLTFHWTDLQTVSHLLEKNTAYSFSQTMLPVGDVDGDGNYEIILKWDPSNAHDNAHDGYTGNVYFDCYRLTGEKLWRIDMGKNIRAGAHYTSSWYMTWMETERLKL